MHKKVQARPITSAIFASHGKCDKQCKPIGMQISSWCYTFGGFWHAAHPISSFWLLQHKLLKSMIFKTHYKVSLHKQQAESVEQREPPIECRCGQLPLVHPDWGAYRPRRWSGQRNCCRNRPVHQEWESGWASDDLPVAQAPTLHCCQVQGVQESPYENEAVAG